MLRADNCEFHAKRHLEQRQDDRAKSVTYITWPLIVVDLFARRQTSHASTGPELALNRNNGPFSSRRGGGGGAGGTGRRRKSWKRWRGRELGRTREKRSACDRNERQPCGRRRFSPSIRDRDGTRQRLTFLRETQRTNRRFHEWPGMSRNEE